MKKPGRKSYLSRRSITITGEACNPVDSQPAQALPLEIEKGKHTIWGQMRGRCRSIRQEMEYVQRLQGAKLGMVHAQFKDLLGKNR